MDSKRIPVLLRAWFTPVVGFGLGASVACILCPATGDLGDAFRPYIVVAFGIVGLFLSSIYAVWLCCRKQ